jgi:hypothetical protein
MRSLPTRLVALAAPVILTACATTTPPQPPSLDLPKPPSDLRAARKGDQVTLTWTIPNVTTDRQTIRMVGPTRICRTNAPGLSECGSPAGELPASSTASKGSAQKSSVSFVDPLPPLMERDNPDATATYAVEVLNRDDRSAGLSNRARVPLFHTLPAPRDFQAHVTAQGIALNWASEPPPPVTPASIHYVVRIYRNSLEGQRPSVVGEVPLGGDHSLTDSTFDWEKTYQYRATIATIAEPSNKPVVEVEGADTPEIKVFADDVFPPAVPSGLQAVFSGPGQQPFIDLIWAPDADSDLAGYNVYRREQQTAPAKLNSELLKTPAYRDSSVAAGKTYFYSVSAVDLRGNESARSEEATETVP